jgi:acetyl esterase/lipase
MVHFLRRDWDETAGWPLPRVREELDRRPYPRTILKKVELRDEKLGDVPVRWFVPPKAAERSRVLFFHGGSYVYGSSRTTHADVIARLALESGVTVVAVEYRLAPEHPYPAQLEDALLAFDGLVASGTSADEIVIAGDSAGGNLALELQIALRDRGTPQAAACVLISPWSDLTMPGQSFTDNDAWDYGTRAVLGTQARAFAGDMPLDDPRLSPVNARLDGLGPILVVVGEVEIPRDDILALANRLRAAKVDVSVHAAKDMPHNPPVLAAYHPNGQRALEEIARFVRRFRAS